MKLSEKTVKLLKNFSGINQSIYIKQGSMLSTISTSKNIFAEASIEDEFPVSFAIYDLVELLNTFKLFKNPVLNFSSDDTSYMYICEQDRPDFRVRYTFASSLSHIVYPKKVPVMDITDVNFKLDNKTLLSIMKASNVMQLPNMIITPVDATHIDINVSDIKDPSSNNFSIKLDASVQAENNFSLVFNMDTFKMLPKDYDIGIANGRLSSWFSDDVDYTIALDTRSEYNK